MIIPGLHEASTMALHGSVSVHTLWLMRKCGHHATPMAFTYLPFAELRVSSFFMWFSLFTVNFRM